MLIFVKKWCVPSTSDELQVSLIQDNAFKWNDMSTCQLLLQWGRTSKTNKVCWYSTKQISSSSSSHWNVTCSWKNAHLVLNNNHTLTLIKDNQWQSMTINDNAHALDGLNMVNGISNLIRFLTLQVSVIQITPISVTTGRR